MSQTSLAKTKQRLGTGYTETPDRLDWWDLEWASWQGVTPGHQLVRDEETRLFFVVFFFPPFAVT
ncbi:hypothetical protein CCUS01_12579 [Colletotrichum cuscutae]|uniref:Uncharacterized protein n=1 Tax=Colletotrichum cuscutae TaxID=1209917 RepID=A0AAI9XEK4_9PEZI|nr:hypothetical protein CCUS01_12579 [Colletotrichum cuscutae]